MRGNSSSLGRRSPRRNADGGRAAALGPSTKDLLIATGERLFGRLGIDGVSLREIAAAAGQINCSAVQYHFKDKSGLVSAILRDRVHRIEALRCERLRMLEADKSLLPRELLKTLWMPIMAVRGQDGEHTFCRFLLQYLLQPQIAEHPFTLYESADHRRAKLRQDFACLAKVVRLIRGQHRNLTRADFGWRLHALSFMFLSAVVEHDNARLAGRGRRQAKFDIEPILEMSVVALSAPFQH